VSELEVFIVELALNWVSIVRFRGNFIEKRAKKYS
jgi:hypothetical protein